ncbi:Glycine betaine ABC transport system, ATP-binding protein OpuAA [Bacillus cereus]|nr:Glycine betaine ABC transport system, ATP-binding protein OpuAA [Bacillus cereus]
MIQFNQVSKSYEDGTKAVNSLHLEIKKGEFFVLIGPSGCGKTTTMKMINRLIETTEGSILIDGKDIQQYNINELRWDIGYVLQQIALFPHMTIAENIAVVPEMRKWTIFLYLHAQLLNNVYQPELGLQIALAYGLLNSPPVFVAHPQHARNRRLGF